MLCWASPSTSEEGEEQEVPHAPPRERSLRRGSLYALAANSKELLPLSGARVLEEFPLARVQDACMKPGGHDRGVVAHRGYDHGGFIGAR